jgi:hypothetical protein
VNFLDASSPGFEHGPLLINGELSTYAPPAHPRIGRRSRRIEVALGAGLRQRGAGPVTIQVLDLSVDGFRARAPIELAEDDDVWLRLPGLEAYAARVVWTDGAQIGCVFARPLHPAVLEMIVEHGRR